MGDLFAALVEVIKSHPEQTISGVVGIAGTLFGLTGALVSHWWKNKGELAFLPVEVWKRGAPGWENAEQYVCSIILRAINTLPDDRTLSLTNVGYYSVRPQLWRRAKPLLLDPYPTIGHEKESIRDQDIYLPAKSTLRLHIETATPHRADDSSVSEMFPKLHWLCVEVIHFPHRKAKRIWIDLADALDAEDRKNDERFGARFARH